VKIRIDKLFFFLFILFLPAQLGKHFWPEFSYVVGFKIDYYSPTLFLTDILLMFAMVFWVLSAKIRLRKILSLKRVGLILLIIIFLIGNSICADRKELVFFKVIKLLEMIGVIFFVRRGLRLRDYRTVFILLGIGVIYETLLSVGQVITQSSLGGLFWYLGERSFNLASYGISKAIIDGGEVLRAYGTFSHPNSMAGYLVLVLFIALLFWKEVEKKRGFFVFWWVVFGLCFITGLLTFSKVGLIGFIFVGVKTIKKLYGSERFGRIIRNILNVFLIIMILGAGTVFFNQSKNIFSYDKLSVTRRGGLNEASIEMFKDSFVWGVGLNNYIVKLGEVGGNIEVLRWFQPEHNVYLLVLAEAGIVGFLLFSMGLIYIISAAFRKKENMGWFLGGVLFILIVFLFDHYFWTLQQNQMILAVFLGMGMKKSI